MLSSSIVSLALLLASANAVPTFSGMGSGGLPSLFNRPTGDGSSSSSLFGGLGGLGSSGGSSPFSGLSGLSGLGGLGGGSGGFGGLGGLGGGSSGFGGLGGLSGGSGLGGLGSGSSGFGGLGGLGGGSSGFGGLGGLSGGSGLGGLGGGSSGLGGLGGLGGGSSGLGGLGGGSSGLGSLPGSSTGGGSAAAPLPAATSAAPAGDGHDHSHGDTDMGTPAPTATSATGGGHDHGTPSTGGGDDGHNHGGAPAPQITGTGPIPEGYNVEPPLDPKKPGTPGARMIEQRFGPYKITAGGEKNFFELNVKMPCKNCWVTATQGVLEYADGKEANIDTGAWLHHMVMFQRGTTGLPSTGKFQCTSGIGALLGGGFGSIGGGTGSGVFWSTGNERAVKRINGDGKFAHKIVESTSAMMTFELMNESKKDAEYYMRFIYEVLDFNQPEAKGYSGAVGIWMDVGGCTGSNVPAKQGVYQLESPVYKVSTPGRLLEASGHLHDGGTHIDIIHNGKVLCTPRVLYGRTPGTREPADSPHAGMQHISDTTSCRDFGKVKAGDELKLIAYYDAVKYPQMVHGGELHPVMGISAIYMAPDTPF